MTGASTGARSVHDAPRFPMLVGTATATPAIPPCHRAFGVRVPMSFSHRSRSGVPLLVAVATVVSPLAAIARQTASQTAAAQIGDVEAALVAATADYVKAFNERRYDDLAAQWTSDAELVEGGGSLVGRTAIIESIRGWIGEHPQARIAIRLTGTKPLGATAARVRGVIGFVEKPGAKPVETRFESLRVLETGAWLIAESRVEPSQVEALDALDWMVGEWKATDRQGGGTVEATYQRVAGGHLILGGIRVRGADGGEMDVVELIHPDKATGTVRSWVFDSTGARAEGTVETDGTTFNRRFVGTTADGAAGSVARFVQVLVPTGERGFTMQSIERSLDGRPLPDREPVHFVRTR